MCHRFNLTTSQEMVATFLKSFSVTVPPALLPSKDYYPICEVLTLRMIGENEWTIEPRSWGFLPRNWKPSDKVRTRKSFQRGKINARSETVDQTWPWKLAFPAQRCVLLASCFLRAIQKRRRQPVPSSRSRCILHSRTLGPL